MLNYDDCLGIRPGWPPLPLALQGRANGGNVVGEIKNVRDNQNLW